MLGNPNVIHEACGYTRYSVQPNLKNPISKELCLRWIQFSSLNPFARINNWEMLPIWASGEKKERDSLENSIKLRYKLSMYLYAYQLHNSISVSF
jgi:alpha-glucosidase (family GH31 glycosyl hydrolase)